MGADGRARLMVGLEQQAAALKDKIVKTAEAWRGGHPMPNGVRLEFGVAPWGRRDGAPPSPSRAYLVAAAEYLAGEWEYEIVDYVGGGCEVMIMRYRGEI